MGKKFKPQLCYTDAGGTFTDTFVVDPKGDFILGKAPTTTHDISEGYFNSIRNAIEEQNLTLENLFSTLQVAGYGSTIVINTLVTRTGMKLGLLITRGFEDYLIMERGLQTFEGYTLQDRLHAVTHIHNKPLIPRDMIRGITERIDIFGSPVIPIYEHEVGQAAQELIDKGAEGIVICFIYSFQNRDHEDIAGNITREIIAKSRKDIPVFLSVDVNPVMREYARLNSTVIEGYAGHFARKPLLSINDKIKELGFKKGELQILLSYGGLASVEHSKMVESVESGPVGGVMGAKYIGDIYGFDNIIATDVGGTTFDVGMIRDGEVTINREPTCARFRLGVPMIEVDSIGAGGGTYISLDSITGRIEVGPDSAGANPGPICYGLENETPTITDVDLILGYLNPVNFLGGKMKLDIDKAKKLFKEKIADPLGMGILDAAEGVKNIFDARCKGSINAMLMGKGYNSNEYYLLSYGGGGPTHVAGYTEGINFKGVLVFPYSSVFSAFGAAACPYEHHYHRAITAILPPGSPDEFKTFVGSQLNGYWEELEQRGLKDMKREGYTENQVEFKQIAMIRYGKQLDDIPVTSPINRINTPKDMDDLIGKFEDMYSRIFTMAAKHPQAGYLILEVAVIASVQKPKPVLKKHVLQGEKPCSEAIKGHRDVFFNGELVKADVYEMDILKSGNNVKGPVIIEHPTTTLVVPNGKSIYVDEYRTMWLR